MKRDCVVCGTNFDVGRSNTRVTCSPQCHRVKKRGQSRATYFRSVDKPLPPPKPPVQLTDVQKGYIAGFIDGEGWIGITKRKRTWRHCTLPHYHRPALVIGQAKRAPLDYIAELLGHRDIAINRARGYWELRLHPPCVKWLLPQIGPHLVLKGQQADLLLRFVSECRYQGKELTTDEWQRREDLRLAIRALNEKPLTARRRLGQTS